PFLRGGEGGHAGAVVPEILDARDDRAVGGGDEVADLARRFPLARHPPGSPGEPEDDDGGRNPGQHGHRAAVLADVAAGGLHRRGEIVAPDLVPFFLPHRPLPSIGRTASRAAWWAWADLNCR